MLWAALLLPHLAMDVLLRQHPEPTRPLALITGQYHQRVLLDVNPSAHAAGLKPGMALNAAQALLPDVEMIEHRPECDAQLRQTVLVMAYRYSSMVCIDGEDAVLLEVAASLRLFGPWPRLERLLREDLQALGLRARIALAPTASAAIALARWQDGLAVPQALAFERAVAHLPIGLAPFAPNQIALLHSMGIRVLWQVMSLPRAGLSKRFGPDLLQVLDRLRGHAADPREWYLPPAVFDSRMEFHHEIELSTALMFPLKRLLQDLAVYLRYRDGGVQSFEVLIEHEQEATTRFKVGLLHPEREAARLFELAKLKLETIRMAAPARALRLRAAHLPPFIPVGRDLFESNRIGEQDFDGLRERLRARLGNDAVVQFELHPDPRPERTQRVCAQLAREPTALHSPPRPLWLLPRPMPLRDVNLRVLSGPERIESGWWDGFDVRRDYYVLRTSLGQTAWAFRVAGVNEGGWVLHGWFS